MAALTHQNAKWEKLQPYLLRPRPQMRVRLRTFGEKRILTWQASGLTRHGNEKHRSRCLCGAARWLFRRIQNAYWF